MKTALVTGGNQGIGFAICSGLMEKGFRVILTARDPEKGKEAAKSIGAEFLPLDVTDEKSIRELAATVKKNYGTLDVLVNNAGILLKEDQSMLGAQQDVIHRTMSTNAFGPLMVTQALVPLMPKGGRVIMMSSSGGSMSDPVGGWSPVYCASKSLLNAITRHLASELEGKLLVNAMSPGWVRTRMGGRSAPRTVEQGADTAIWLATNGSTATGKFFNDRKEIPF